MHIEVFGFPRWPKGKESICQPRRHRQHGFNPWVGNIPWREHGNPLQYPCLKNPRGRGLWEATVHEVAKSRTQLMNWACTEVFKSPPNLLCVHWNNEDNYPLAFATYSGHGTNGNKTYHLKICIPVFQLCTFFQRIHQLLLEEYYLTRQHSNSHLVCIFNDCLNA